LHGLASTQRHVRSEVEPKPIREQSADGCDEMREPARDSKAGDALTIYLPEKIIPRKIVDI
jgi:hypothetical protein